MGFVKIRRSQNLFLLRRARAPFWRCPPPLPEAPPSPAAEPGARLREAPATHLLTHWPSFLMSSAVGLAWGWGWRNKSDKTLLPSDRQALEKRWALERVITFRRLLKIYFLSTYGRAAL